MGQPPLNQIGDGFAPIILPVPGNGDDYRTGSGLRAQMAGFKGTIFS
jgi:hypothetical protein